MGSHRQPYDPIKERANKHGTKRPKIPTANNGLTNMIGNANKGRGHIDFEKSMFDESLLKDS